MREQAPMVMFPDADGNPWVPASDDDDSTPILPLGDPGRLLQRCADPSAVKLVTSAVNLRLLTVS